MLQPKKVKHRKWMKGRRRDRKITKSGSEIKFGSFGLKAQGSAWITSRQIEAARRSMTRYVQRGGKIWIKIFPDKPITTKGAEVPMGGGKGNIDHYAVPVASGRIMFEMDGVTEEIAREAMRRAAHKLPVKTKFVKR
ncbi:50S ribosomal protein L16 [Patescibacteria group bacterium]|nr:50S ribosomal protein L16 [Patescibacteria group bacterium]